MGGNNKKERRFWDRARLTAKRASTLLRNTGIPLGSPARLVAHVDYLVGPTDVGARHAFDVKRPQRILDQLYKTGILSPKQVLRPDPVSRDDLLLVHTPEYLEEISNADQLADALLLPRAVLGDDALMTSILSQTGGTILAAEQALAQRVPVINLGGGFHHAQRDRAEGFCAINDVAVAIRRLQQRRQVQQVLVVDLDYHQGNGTARIFSQDESVFTLSIHGQSWSHLEGKNNNLDLELSAGTGDEEYLSAVRGTLEEALSRVQPQLAIYLAGADPFVEDELGDFRISEEGLLERDLYVCNTLQGAKVPCAVLLAGGYSPLAWCIPYNMIFSLLTGQRIHPAYRPSNIEAKFRRVKESLTLSDLRRGRTDIALGSECLQGSSADQSSSNLFMGFYTCEGLMLVLERYGFTDLIRERGFEDLQLSIKTADPDRQLLRVHFTKEDPDHLLIELVANFRTLVTAREVVDEGILESFQMLNIEWLLMQNPRVDFSLDRQWLPGQQKPGLGLGRWMVELLRMMAERLRCDGLMNVPQHYHNAHLYAKKMLFFNPEYQGYFEAIRRDLDHLPFVESSVIVDQGRLINEATGLPVPWEGQAQVMPINAGLNRYFARQGYIKAVAEARGRYHFKVI